MRRGAWCGQHAAALPCSPLTRTLVHPPPPPFTPLIGAAVARGLSLPRLQRIAAGCEIPGISLICSITFANSRILAPPAKEHPEKNIKPRDTGPTESKESLYLGGDFAEGRKCLLAFLVHLGSSIRPSFCHSFSRHLINTRVPNFPEWEHWLRG